MSSRDPEQLCLRHSAALYPFVLNLTRNEADTLDVLQELFISLAQHPERLAAIRNEREFLFRMVHNLSIDLIRRRESRTRVHEAVGLQSAQVFAPGSHPDEEAYRRELSLALGELPPDQRAVVHLKLWEGLTFEAISETLQIPLNTAASRYRYGLEKLRDRLRPLYEEIR
jgi:RNA polymerase sigma-70 factor (ECF subfamily)